MDVVGTVVITGAAAGIGRAIALRFVHFGCRKLLLADVDNAGLEGTRGLILAQAANARVELRALDLTNEKAPEKVVKDTVDNFGAISYLVNCAGTPGGFATSTTTTVEMFDAVQSLNVRATWLLQRAAIQQMLKQDLKGGERGSIVNVGSVLSHIGIPRLSAYVTSKHAILGMTRAEAIDYAPEGIRVNCVAPGLINTNLGAAIPQEIQDQQLTLMVDKTPMKRAGTPEEVANCVVFLCSEMASYITGSSLVVDGGFTCT